MSATVFRAFVACSPGLEALLQAELAGLGASRCSSERGGVEISGPQELVWAANRDCRLAESVRVRLKAFEARTFAELEEALARMPWHAYLRRGAPATGLRIDVACHRSRLYHSDAVAERVERVIASRLGGAGVARDDQAAGPRISVRILRDRVQVSVDASGERLHRRGYRTHVGRAPIRETLAAALAMLLERQGGTGPVWDPFCGSGTLLLEWLALVTGTAPGARRRFAFEQWPLHDADAYARWVAERDSAPRADVGQVQVFGSDVSEAAISAARSNAQRAPWAKTTEWWAEDFRQAAERIPPGTRIVTNPPYGVRMGRGRSAQVLTAFEELLAARMDLRPVVLLCGDPDYLARSRLGWREQLAFKSGGLPVRALSLNI